MPERHRATSYGARPILHGTCSLHVIHPQLLKRNIYLYYLFFCLWKGNIYVDAMCTSASTRRFSPVAVWLIKHRPVHGGSSGDLFRDFRKFLALFRHLTKPRLSPLKSYNRANASQAPSGHHTVTDLLYFYISFILKTKTKEKKTQEKPPLPYLFSKSCRTRVEWRF